MNRIRYNKYSDLVDRRELKESHRELSYLYAVVDNLHLLIPDTNLSCDEVETSFWAQYPEASHAIYDGLFKDLRAVEVGEEVAEVVLQQMARKKAALRLSEASFELSQGRGSLEDVQRLTEALGASDKLEAVDTYERVTTDLEELANHAVNKPGLRWRLDCLNKALGSVRKGDFGFLFARPETGKTTFLASEVSFMVDQATGPVVWFNMEEQGEKVMLRFYQGYFGVSLEVLLGNVAQYKKRFLERVGDKFILIDTVLV